MGNIDKFEAMANQYDSTERIWIANIISDAIREQISGAKDKTMIDFGCGTGLVGMNLLDVFKNILFIDASANMVEQVKLKIEKKQIQNADSLFIDLTKEIPADLCADYIIVSQVLLHIKDTDSVLKGLFEILNPSGRLFIIDFDKNEEINNDLVHNGFHQEELIKIIRNIGFEKATAKTFYHGERLFMNKAASLFILDAVKCKK